MFGNKNKTKLDTAADFQYFTIFDTKVGIYREPVLAVNEQDLLRQLFNLYRDPRQKDNQLVTHAEDFQLFRIGSYSRRTGTIETQAPEHIANFHELKAEALRNFKPEPIQMNMVPPIDLVKPDGH